MINLVNSFLQCEVLPNSSRRWVWEATFTITTCQLYNHPVLKSWSKATVAEQQYGFRFDPALAAIKYEENI